MTVSNTINQVTQRIIEKSKTTRESYLQKVAAAASEGINRTSLDCSNLAHGIASCSTAEKKNMANEKAANIGIISAYNDMLSAHHPYANYPELIKNVAIKHGITAQVAGAVPAMCDGVTQGRPGMELSLFSRDLIAMSTAMSLSHNMFDGVLCLGVCDKIVPGLLIGALSFGHLPTVFLPAGPMSTGQANADKVKVRQAYAKGEAGRKELLASECASYHGPGTCTFYGTANSNQMLVEIMGLHLPGSSFIPAMSNARDIMTAQGVKQLITHLDGNGKKVSLADIIDEKAIVNGIVGLLATGGSTNHAIHLVAIARAAGIIFDWQDVSDLSAIVPLLCRIYPNGGADINHFQASGGMGFLMKELLNAGYLHNDVSTIMGEGLDVYTKLPELVGENASDELLADVSSDPSSYNIQWLNELQQSNDETILRPADNPFSHEGGLKLLTGNIGRSVIKISAIAEQHLIVEAPAMVFSSQEALQESFEAGELNKDFVAVIRFQGPKTNGMPELHKLIPLLGVLQDKGFHVAIVTDGRMSGASGKVPAAIHLTPEAAEGGVLATIQDGDVIRLDATTGGLNVQVADEEMNQRQPAIPEKLETTGDGRELFRIFRQNVNSAEQGATVF